MITTTVWRLWSQGKSTLLLCLILFKHSWGEVDFCGIIFIPRVESIKAVIARFVWQAGMWRSRTNGWIQKDLDCKCFYCYNNAGVVHWQKQEIVYTFNVLVFKQILTSLCCCFCCCCVLCIVLWMVEQIFHLQMMFFIPFKSHMFPIDCKSSRYLPASHINREFNIRK